MTEFDEVGRPQPPDAGDELSTLIGFLEFQRATFSWKCSGLTSEQLRVSTAASAMTLGGMLKHLALVEDWWFTQWLLGESASEPWDQVDWEQDADWDWNSAKAQEADYLSALWSKSVDDSRKAVVQALSEGDLGQLARRESDGPHRPSEAPQK